MAPPRDFDVTVTSQVQRLAHALNVSLGEGRAKVSLKARRFRHCASQALVPFGHNKIGRAIGRWYCPYFCINCSVFTTEVPDAGYEMSSIPRSNCFSPLARGLMVILRDAC